MIEIRDTKERVWPFPVWLTEKCPAAGPYRLNCAGAEIFTGTSEELRSVLITNGWSISEEPNNPGFEIKRTKESLQFLVDKETPIAHELLRVWGHRLELLSAMLQIEGSSCSSDKWEWKLFREEHDALDNLSRFLKAALVRYALGFRS